MEKHLLMDISNGGLLYQIFYLFAFLTAYLIILYEGYKRKFPMPVWVLLLASVRLAGVIGTKVFSYSWGEWQYMFQNHTFLQNQEKTMFGCALLAVVTYLIVRKLLNFRYYAWDTIALAIPAAVSVQTIGCFFYGCCYGTPTTFPWAVKYPVMSLAHYHQFMSGQLTHSDLYSLPVHPVQLYGLAGGLLVIFLVLRFRRYWKAEGSLLLSSLIFFALMRFVLEFFRDPLSNKSGGEMLWIFKEVQWQYLIFALLMSSLLFWREKTFKVKPVVRNYRLPGLNAQIIFLLSLVIIILLLRNWFTLPEVIALNIALLPAIFFVGLEMIKKSATLRYKWVYICILILPLFLMSQTIPQTQIDTVAGKKYNISSNISGGFATGNYTVSKTIHSGEGCSRVSQTEYFTQKYIAGAIGYGITKETPDKKVTIHYGANLLFGDYMQTRQSDNLSTDKTLFGINPYIGYDFRWIGIGGGLHIGNLFFTTGDTYKGSTVIPEKSYSATPLFPQFYFRLGPVRYFFMDFHLADQFPSPFPGMAFQAGFGTGFGAKNGLKLRVGIPFLSTGGSYFSAYIPIKNRIFLEPMYYYQGGNRSNYLVSLPENQFSLGVSYRFKTE